MKLNFRYFILFLVVHCFSYNALTQTSNISGIINSYAAVTSIGSQSVNVSTFSGFAVGDKVLLIQMKGASIDTTNTSNFGTITSYNDAGNYEMLVISAITSTTITFTNPILRTYNTIGVLQLVKIPVYNHVNVIGSLTCLPWNGSTGGVLVFEASGNIVLNANIDVTGKGFLGGSIAAGQFLSCVGNTTGFKLPNTSLLSGNKGEGIVIIKPSFAKGLGALANGGGAGNDVNGGGAGGGNYGLGGHGGNAKCSSSPITLCGGYEGKNCNYSNANNKIFLGGGGGSGHENDGVSTAGVSGGGIIIIRCGGSISGNGNFINANGANNTLLAGNDGQGGGGAGGTILIEACSTSSLNVSVIGGNGGTDNFSGPDCHGKGGGGGGGTIWTSSPLSYNSFLSGGNPGVFNNSNSQCYNTSNGATAGQIGGALTGLVIPGGTPLTSLNNFSISTSSNCYGGGNSTAIGTLSTTLISPIISYTWINSSGIVVGQTNNTTSLIDSVGNLSNGVYTLSVTLTTPCATLTGAETLTINCVSQNACGGSLQFNNTTDAVSLPINNQIYSSNGFTWEVWFKLNTPFSSNARALIFTEDPVVYEDIFLGFGWSFGTGNFPVNHLGFKVDGPNATTGPTNVSCEYAPPGGFLLSTWYHAAGVMDYTTHTAKLYLNGVLVDTKTVNSDPFTRPIKTRLSDSSSIALGGNEDEVRIWNKVRTASEIAADYNQCLTGNETNLLMYYRCNQLTGLIVADATSNGLNGSFVNSTSWSSQQPSVSGLACASGLNLTVTSPSICAGNSVTLIANGATTYTWSNNSNLNSITVSPSSTTVYTVTGAIGTCTNQAVSTVSVVPSSTISITGNTIICAGQSATLTASGSSNYIWNSGSITNTIVVNPIISTNYSVTAPVGVCSNTAVATVSVVSIPSLTTSPNTSFCQGASSSVSLTVSGANAYSWANSATLSSATGSAVVASPITTTNYTVTGSSSICSNTAIVTVSVNPSPTITAVSFTNTSCGLSNGAIIVTSLPSNNTYTWSSGISSTTNAASNLAFGNYTITANNGTCQTNTVISIFSSVPLSITSSTVIPSNCNLNDGSISVVDNMTGSNYSWSPNVSATNSATGLPTGNYALTILNGACSTSTIFNVGSTGGPIGFITITAPNCESEDGSIIIDSITSGVTPFFTNFNNQGYTNSMLFENLSTGSYSLSIRDSSLCETEYILTVPDSKTEFTLYIPNSFTPNNDKINDVWYIKGICLDNINCSIYNRWGEKIKELKDINDGWDGTYKGASVPDGVYVYLIEVTTKDGTVNKAGHITVFR